MKGRPSQLTEAARRRLEQEADIIAQHTPYKKLAAELGVTTKYVSNFISRTLRARVGINVEKASSDKHRES